ncbi:hypothetical protein C1645_875431 [Glomus cerebriforme]|uniref:Uncharacterized protein n=1 Tax=Glomus cerebriforme TaxID=658196 RepID=A0A397T288_9GLOM|nr:hypothetical protein C1645_875431 [Glomus cerebriforme]
MSSDIVIDSFQNITAPETNHIQNNIKTVLDGFNQMSMLEVRNLYQTEFQNDTVQAFVKRILDEGKNFCKLTHDSVIASNKISNYCTDIISYVSELTKSKVSGEDFHVALKELLSNANKCKDEAVVLWKGYTQICQDLKDIYDLIKEYDNHLGNEMVKHEKNSVIKNQDKKEAKIIKWTYIVSSAGMTVLAPVSLGITLLGSAILGYLANEKAEEEKECRLSRNDSRDMVEKLISIRSSVNVVITQTSYIIKIIDHFQEFWDQRVIEIQNLIEDFEKKKDGMVGYNTLTGPSVIRKWEKVNGRYTSYSTIVLSLLNSTTVNRRIVY